MVAVLVLLCVLFKCEKSFRLVFCRVVCQLLLVSCGCCVQAVVCYYGVSGMQAWCVSMCIYIIIVCDSVFMICIIIIKVYYFLFDKPVQHD